MITETQWNEFVEAIRYEMFRQTLVTIYDEPVIEVDTTHGILYVRTDGGLRKRYSFEESLYENTSFNNLCDAVKLTKKLAIKDAPKEQTVTLETLTPGYWYVKNSAVDYFIVHVLKNQLSPEGEWMVWMTDREGSIDIEEIGIENFIRKVPEP